MNEKRFYMDKWTIVVIDKQWVVVEVSNPDCRLFFGENPKPGLSITSLFPSTTQGKRQLSCLVQGIGRSERKGGTSYLEYFSTHRGETVSVSMRVERCVDGTICLYAFASDPEESALAHCQKGSLDEYLLDRRPASKQEIGYEKLFKQYQKVLESLPIGVSLYDPFGTPIFYNDTLCDIYGVDKEAFRSNPINIHTNPLIPQEVKEAFCKRLPIHLDFPCDFSSLLGSNSSHTRVHHIEISGEPIPDCNGEIDCYAIVSWDVTEKVNRDNELRQSKRKTELAMAAADIMLWEFDVNMKLFYSDNEPINGFDRSKPLTIEQYMNYVHPDDHDRAYALLDKMISGEDFSLSFEFGMNIPGKDDWQYCTIIGSPYEKDSSNKVIRYIGVRKNNTDLQKRKLLQDNILNSIPIPILIKDVNDNYRYIFCNEESFRLFGSRVDKSTYDVMEADEVARIEKTDKEVLLTGKPYFGLEHIQLKDGRNYDMIVRKSIIYDESKRLLLTVRWDQSLQNELERRSKLLSLTLESMRAYTWFYEPDKMEISYGDGFEQGGRKASYANTLYKFIEYIHPEDRETFRQSLEKVVSQESGFWTAEYRTDFLMNGLYEWVETRGILETAIINDIPTRYMYGMTISVEEHKKTEMVLRNSKEELNKVLRQNEIVLNNTNSGLAYITTDYVVQWENISVCSASLSHEAYKQGTVCYESAHGRTSPCENCVLQRALISRQVERIDFKFENGHTIEVFATPVFKDDNSVDGIVVRLDDVTQRERMIEELKQAKALAEQSDKLKSAFLANMSHEIRTPLNAIVGFSGLLMESNEQEEQEEYIKIINNNNDLLLKLISDILDLSKIEAGSVELSYEKFDLSEYFNEIAISLKQRVTNPNIRLIVSNPYSSCIVELDRNRITQIITNYVTNSIKYTVKGFIEMGYECMDRGVKFFVRDSGIGIPDEKKHKVFHRFEKLDEFAQGTGLGLSICRAIAESMGGSVGFESEHGEGSRFWAILPSEKGASVSYKPEEPQTTSSDTSSISLNNCAVRSADQKVILVAEDIPSNYLLVSALLKKKYQLVHAKNGIEAVEMVKNRHVDMMLMDMKMPQMDGLTATIEIRKFNTQLPIIALTAHAFDADKQAALNAGCNEYLVKPINKEQLFSVVNKYCR